MGDFASSPVFLCAVSKEENKVQYVQRTKNIIVFLFVFCFTKYGNRMDLYRSISMRHRHDEHTL